MLTPAAGLLLRVDYPIPGRSPSYRHTRLKWLASGQPNVLHETKYCKMISGNIIGADN